MARNILNTTLSAPRGRLEMLTRLYGPVTIVDASGVELKGGRAAANLRDEVARQEAAGHQVLGVIIPQNFLGDVGDGRALGECVDVLSEEFVRGPDGRARSVGKDPASGRDIFRVAGYRRLVRAEVRSEPVEPGGLKPLTGRVLAVSRHNPEGREEVVAAAFGQHMEVLVEDVPFNGRPKDAICQAVDGFGGVDAVIVPAAIQRELRFGDVFGDVAVLTEVTERTPAKEAGGRDVFRVTGLRRFRKAEVVTEAVTPRTSVGQTE